VCFSFTSTVFSSLQQLCGFVVLQITSYHARNDTDPSLGCCQGGLVWEKRGFMWVGFTWHRGAAGCVACSGWELLAGARAGLCQVLRPTKGWALHAVLREAPLCSVKRSPSWSLRQRT